MSRRCLLAGRSRRLSRFVDEPWLPKAAQGLRDAYPCGRLGILVVLGCRRQLRRRRLRLPRRLQALPVALALQAAAAWVRRVDEPKGGHLLDVQVQDALLAARELQPHRDQAGVSHSTARTQCNYVAGVPTAGVLRGHRRAITTVVATHGNVEA